MVRKKKSVKLNIRRGPPSFLNDSELAQIEAELGVSTPNEVLRDRISSCVFDYYWSVQHGMPPQSQVNKQLVAIRSAAYKLNVLLSDPVLSRSETLEWAKSHLLRRCGIDTNELSVQLDAICDEFDDRKPNKGGRPRSSQWEELILELANIFEETTGKKPSVTENEHRTRFGERYSGAFVRIATVIDRSTAAAGLRGSDREQQPSR
jgi:hypothetical protein